MDVPISTYVPASCGDAGGAQVVFTGLGDFQPTSAPSETIALGSNGFSLAALPPQTREVVLGPVGDGGWAGTAFVPEAGSGLELLALPLNRACALSATVSLAGAGGTTLGMVDGTHALVVSGPLPPYLVDLGTGSVTLLQNLTLLQNGPQRPPQRAYASVTPFGGGALVAGGEAGTNIETQSTAVVYTPGPSGTSGTFGEPFTLPAGQRKKHGAVVLSNGSTLLVGGITDPLVTGRPGTLVPQIEEVTPPGNVTIVGSLKVPRTQPTVLALPTGDVFVGGGFDAAGTPVTTTEWFSGTDLSSPRATVDLCGAGTEQVFAATEEGAVLAVMGPRPATHGCSNVHLLTAAGDQQASPLSPPPAGLRIFQGPQASPAILTDTGAFRWNPWQAELVSMGAGAAGTAHATMAFVSASPGLALWLGDDNQLWTLRFDTRGPYATDFYHQQYLDTDSLDTAPDRLPSDASVDFQVATGARLANGGTVFLTDATYADLTASVTLPLGGGVDFVLRAPAGSEVTCAVSNVPAGGTAQLARSGTSIVVSVGIGPGQPCAGLLDQNARVAIGLRGPTDGGVSVVRALTVTR